MFEMKADILTVCSLNTSICCFSLVCCKSAYILALPSIVDPSVLRCAIQLALTNPATVALETVTGLD